MKQHSLAVTGFEKYRKKTRKELFLDKMEKIIPWGELYEVIEPNYLNPLIHSIAVTPANVHDSQVLEDLLHGNETFV